MRANILAIIQSKADKDPLYMFTGTGPKPGMIASCLGTGLFTQLIPLFPKAPNLTNRQIFGFVAESYSVREDIY